MPRKKDELEYKRNIFLTGSAGTGKTYKINEYVKKHPNTLLCASTGTAAININGTTAHRLFSIPVPAYGGDPNKLPPSKLKVFEKADTVIIDEISMLRNDAFAFAIKVLKRAEKLYKKKIKLIVSGDFFQLPPIVKKKEENYLKRYGFSKTGYAFTTKEWASMNFKIVNLTEVKRQKNKEFLEQLTLLRNGDTKVVKYFNQFYKENLPDDAIYICGTNAEADKINTEYLNSINSVSVAYLAKKEGITGKDLPCDEIILLKPGLKIMFTANDQMWNDNKFNAAFIDNPLGRYQNGMFGIVKETKPDYIVVELEDGSEIKVKPHKWSIYNYKVDKTTKELKKKEIGSITQMPVKIAKAITIHKSQGKTFNKVILSPQIFATGQLYVALSRVTGPEGLYLTEEITKEHIKTDKTVVKFFKDKDKIVK